MSDEEITAMRERLIRIETIVGDEADSGLRGDMKILFERLRQIEVRMYMAVGGGMVVVFIIEKVWK
ncbi:MAG: hypothetical protein WC205_04275 [Opitutaceae bacterium]|jgi:hypothetical protein